MRNTKKGFTLVELLVVIAILAILATVSIVGYTSFIDRANISVDQQAVEQLNDILYADQIGAGDPPTLEGVIALLSRNGFNPDYNCAYEGYTLGWLGAKNVIVLLEDDKIVYPEQYVNEASVVYSLAGWAGAVLTSEEFAEIVNEDEKIIEIGTPEELAAFAQAVNNGETYAGYTVRLINDIDLNNQPWKPIGHAVITNNKYDWDNSPYFAGTFDGQGYTISNLYVDNPDTNIQGLFGYGKLVEVKNVNFHNAYVAGLRRSGVIVGQNDGSVKVSNVHFTGDIKVEVFRNEAGAIVGRGGLGAVTNVTMNANEGSYIKCSATSNENWEYVGGLWGHAWPSEAKNITSNIDVFAYASSTGGIGGGAAANSENVTCTGNVTMTIKDTEIHKGTIQCWQTNGTIYGFGVGSNNASTQTGCTSTGTLSIGGEVITDLGLNDLATGFGTNDIRFGAPYNAAGVITIVD